MSKQEQTCNFSIKYNKDSHSINIDTYAKSLISMGKVLREVGYQTSGAYDISVNVTAQQEGSFDVVLQIIGSILPMIPTALDTLEKVVSITIELIELKKHSKEIDESKTEIHGDDVILNNSDGNRIKVVDQRVYNIYNENQVVNDAISENFQAVKNDPEIDSVTIRKGDINITIDRVSFDDLAQKHDVKISNDNDVVVVPTELIVRKVVFDNRSRLWDFLYQGIPISAKIDDDDFWYKISSGERFAQGDKLVADLHIARKYDDSVNAYINDSYTVKSVRDHVERDDPEQTSFI